MNKICSLLIVALPISFYLLPNTVVAQTTGTIDFLWQGDTYTPPFYKGRALWSNQSKLILVGIPNIPGVSNPASLEYIWTRNGQVLGPSNGTGRNSLAFYDSVLGRAQNIKLEVLSGDGAILASGTINLGPVRPSLLIYENNPLYGILFNKEVTSNYSMRGEEVTFAGFPLFFNSKSRHDVKVQYQWLTNTGTVERSNSVTYRVPDGLRGSSRVTVDAKHSRELIQTARRSFVVKFGDE
ncbi:MAG: hypothetical protein Q8O98_00945 [bacterium]|nr:hypothetical protein [bacterium]